MLAFAAILATLDDPFYDPPEHLVKYETPQQRRSYTAWASKLRDDLIGDEFDGTNAVGFFDKRA